MSTLEQYAHLFAHLRSDKNRNHYPAETLHRAPHKPLLLLAVLDLFAQGTLHSNRVTLTPELGELFTLYWSRVMPPHNRPNISLPFFHLKNDGDFWRLVPTTGNEDVLEHVDQIRSVARLQELVAGAEIASDLADYLSDPHDRDTLRGVLLGRYFSTDAQEQLTEQGEVNVQAFEYSQILLGQRVAKAAQEEDMYRPAVRSQGFRRAIVVIYDYRCALCGIRVVTVDGHTAVDAAHIIPWTESRNDHPTNGIALCKLCHWCFDEGLLSVDQRSTIRISQRLSRLPNVPAHLATLDRRPILGPADSQLAPSISSLLWHQRHVFQPS